MPHDPTDPEPPKESAPSPLLAERPRRSRGSDDASNTEHLNVTLRRIREAQRYREKHLNLSWERLASTPELAAALGKLTELQGLALSSNQLNTTPEFAAALGKLANLQALGLWDNQLTTTTELAVALGKLTKLQTLGLWDNRLTTTIELATALGKLTELQTLGLGVNQLILTHELAEGLGRLTKLQTLGFSCNRLTSTPKLAAALGKLSKLQVLILYGNQLTSSPELAAALGELVELRTLDLHRNQLTSTPQLAAALEKLTKLTRLNLSDNPDLEVPAEELGSDNPARIIRAIREVAARARRAKPEFKVVILGQGRIGKTQLRRRLMGLDPIEGDDPTHSFEWQQLPGTITKPGAGEPGAVHVFDFGGQDRLQASHRFFLSTRRTIYLIGVPMTKTVEQSRLAHWLLFVEDLAEQAARAEAIKAVERAGAHRGADDFEGLLNAARASNPRPPIIVVVTRSHDEKLSRKIDVERVRALCKERATLIEGYDSFGPSEAQAVASAREVLGAIKTAACSDHPAMTSVWTEQYNKEGLAHREQIKKEFGFDPTGLNPNPPRRLMTVDEYLRDICGIGHTVVTSRRGEAYERAMDALRLLRDLGFVHWLGESNELPATAEHLRRVIYSPAWIRTPVYNVLWAEDASSEPLAAARLRQLIRKGSNLTEQEVEDITALMVGCELIFEMQDERGVRRYLVPDRLPPGDAGRLIADDKSFLTGERGFRMSLEFAPDNLMPRLIGRLFARRGYRCSDMTRQSLRVEYQEPRAAMRIDLDQTRAILRVGITADDAGCSKLLATLRADLEEILRPREIDDFKPLTAQSIKISEKKQSLIRERPDFWSAVCPDVIDGETADALADWMTLCDSELDNMPWQLGVLAGIACARDPSLIPIMSANAGRNAPFIKKLISAASKWSKISGVPSSWLKVIETIAPSDSESRTARYETTDKTWEQARKKLSKPHKWLEPRTGRARERGKGQRPQDINSPLDE